MATSKGKLSIIWPITIALLVNKSLKSPSGPLRDKMRYKVKPIITAGTDIKVLNKEISVRRKGNWKKARIKAITSAKGVAISMADKDTPKDNDITSQRSLLPLNNK